MIVDLRREVAQLVAMRFDKADDRLCVLRVHGDDPSYFRRHGPDKLARVRNNRIGFADFDLLCNLSVKRCDARAVSKRQRQWKTGREVWFLGRRQTDAVLNLLS